MNDKPELNPLDEFIRTMDIQSKPSTPNLLEIKGELRKVEVEIITKPMGLFRKEPGDWDPWNCSPIEEVQEPKK